MARWTASLPQPGYGSRARLPLPLRPADRACRIGMAKAGLDWSTQEWHAGGWTAVPFSDSRVRMCLSHKDLWPRVPVLPHYVYHVLGRLAVLGSGQGRCGFGCNIRYMAMCVPLPNPQESESRRSNPPCPFAPWTVCCDNRRMRTCRNCPAPARPGGGECDACNTYRRRNGVDRPAYLAERTAARAARPGRERYYSVYVLFGKGGAVVYVGRTSRSVLRLGQHANARKWWPLVHRARIFHCADLASSIRLEARLILALRPPYNTAIPPRPTTM